MTSKSKAFIGFGALAVSAAFGWLVCARHPKEKHVANGESQEVAQLRATIEDLAGRVDATRLIANSAALASLDRPRATTAGPIPSATPVSETAPAPQEQPQTDTEMVTAVQVDFQNEAKDPVWSASAQRLADQQLKQGLPATSQISGVECRSTMCRATVAHQDVGTYRDYVLTMLHTPNREWRGPLLATLVGTGPDGKAETEIYFMKDQPGEVAASQ